MAVMGILLSPGLARAQTMQVALTPAPAPLLTGVTNGTRSTLSLDVTNTLAGRTLRRVSFTLPGEYTVNGGTGPSGWSATVSGKTVRFDVTSCSQAGLATGARATFLLDVTPSLAGLTGDRTDTMGTTSGSDPCTGFTGWTANRVQFQRRVLLVTGAPSPTAALAPPQAMTVTWTVGNRSSQSKSVTLTRPVLPTTGWTGGTCSPSGIVSVPARQSLAVVCTYQLTASGTFTFSAAATATNATSVGGTTSVQVGSFRAQPVPPPLVLGRPAYRTSIQVVNDSGLPVSQVEVSRPDSTWTWSSGTGASGLAYSGICNGGAALCFTGSLAAGATATLGLQLAAVPNAPATGTYAFQVRATPGSGTSSAVTVPVSITLVRPIPDVSGLTVLSDTGGQVLSWTNVDGPGSPHDGVVIFRTPAPTIPPRPTDFVDYTLPSHPAEVLYADGGGSLVRDRADPAVGAFNYRVCARDANLVYSACNSGFWNGQGYADSQPAPRGGWTHQVGGEALLLPGSVQNGRFGIATNRPAVVILDALTGHRSFDPVPLPGLPSVTTPATQVVDGRHLLFAADQAGTVTAVNLDTGLADWTTSTGESFVAGVTGITRSFSAPAFQQAYPTDLLLLGSATTGNLLAIDATTGQLRWTANPGAQVRALATYDSTTNRFFVPTGAGVAAYDLGPSSPSVPAPPLTGWQRPDGAYRLYCSRTFETDSIACVDASGTLRLVDKATGAVRASLGTGVSSPTTLARITGAAPGFLVGNASRVVRVSASVAPYSLTSAGSFTLSGVRLSSVLVFGTDGYMVVAGSDLRLHKLALSDAHEIGQSPAITSATADLLLGPMTYDLQDRLFLFGTAEGRVWAVPNDF